MGFAYGYQLKRTILPFTVGSAKNENPEGCGNIINVASINGDHIRKNCIPFSAKAGIIHVNEGHGLRTKCLQNTGCCRFGLVASAAVVNGYTMILRLRITVFGYMQEVQDNLLT